MDRARLLLGALCAYGRPVILEQYRKDSCIASTAIAIDALRELGIPAYALRVRTQVHNAAMLAQIEKMGRLPQGERERKAWQRELGAYALGIGIDREEGQPSVHLIAILPEPMLMLDLSIDQAARPQYKINLEPAYGPVTEAFLQGAEPLHFGTPDGVLVRYDADPTSTFHETTPDWVRVDRRERILSKILIKLRMIERSKSRA